MRYLVAFLLSACVFSAQALDSTIRALAVNVNGNQAAVNATLS